MPIIDPEIVALLPTLSTEERQTLKEKIREEGFLYPVVVWKETDILLDGHNRLEICDELCVTYSTVDISFASREEAIQWVIDNQLGRRNLTDARRAYYMGKEYLTKKKPEGRPAGKLSESQTVSGDTAKAVADKHGVSKDTVHRNAAFARAVDAKPSEEKEEILSGKSGKTKEELVEEVKPTKPKDTSLPKSVQNALADTWHADCARTLSKIRTQCKTAFSWSSWLDASVLEHLQAAEDCFTTAIPRRVCPDCNGKKVVEDEACLTCRQGGYLASQV